MKEPLQARNWNLNNDKLIAAERKNEKISHQTNIN